MIKKTRKKNKKTTMIDINSGTGHFSGDDTFIRIEGKENKPLFEVPSQKTYEETSI